MIPSETYKIDYAIIAAMDEELESLMKTFSSFECTELKIDEFLFKIYDYQNNKILISPTGIGTTFSACLLTFIHLHFNPDFIFICGTAGGIKSNLKLRDVIIAEKAFEAEIQDIFDLLKNTPFESCLKHPIKNKYFPAHYSASPELLESCDSLSFGNINVYKGTLVSSNAFPAPKELFDKIKQFDPYSIDMETSAFYQTAWLLNAKVLAIRGISNLLNTDGTDDNVHESDVKGSSDAAARVLLTILDNVISIKNNSTLNTSEKNEEKVMTLIKKYNLQPHPEGGYFACTYKSNDKVTLFNNDRYHNETRSACTSIYYLLNKRDYSAWHILKSDELWYFHEGFPLKIHLIDANGTLTTHLLGNPLEWENATFQICIKAGTYFAAENIDKNTYCLVGCMVAPGFEYCDFELAHKETLLAQYPKHTVLIEKLSKY